MVLEEKIEEKLSAFGVAVKELQEKPTFENAIRTEELQRGAYLSACDDAILNYPERISSHDVWQKFKDYSLRLLESLKRVAEKPEVISRFYANTEKRIEYMDVLKTKGIYELNEVLK